MEPDPFRGAAAWELGCSEVESEAIFAAGGGELVVPAVSELCAGGLRSLRLVGLVPVQGGAGIGSRQRSAPKRSRHGMPLKIAPSAFQGGLAHRHWLLSQSDRLPAPPRPLG